MTDTLLRKRKDRMYSVVSSGADYLALIDTGAAWLASYYRDGDWVEDLATQALTSDPTAWGWVGLYADRYIVSADDVALDVWDLDTDTVESYAAPAGWKVFGAGIVGGTVYWIEIADTWTGGPVNFSVEARLRSASPDDLAVVTTEQTHTFTDAFQWEWQGLLNAGFVINDTAAMAERRADDAVNGEIWNHPRWRFPLNGGAGEDNGGGSTAQELIYGIPAGDSSFLSAAGSSAALSAVDDDVAASPVDHWPTTAPWAFDGQAASLSTNLAGTEVAAFGTISFVPTLTRSLVAGPYSTPTAQFEVIDHPTDGSPSFFFMRG